MTFIGGKEKIKKFTDLRVWQTGHKFVILIYKETESFPYCERNILSNQMRRAVVSITSNIAEGFGRRTYKEKHQFYSISLGSLIEIENQLLIAKDLSYIKKEQFDLIAKEAVKLSKLLYGLIRATKIRKYETNEYSQI